MPSTDVYVEYAPSPALAPFVECFWSTVSEAARPSAEHLVLPDGCVDLLFDLSGSEPEGAVIGTMTRPFRFVPMGAVRIVAARFRPGGARPFLKRPVAEWTDSRQELRELWPECARLEAELYEAPRVDAAVRALERELERSLPRLAPVDARVLAAIERIWTRPAAARVSELGQRVGLSRQHLTRLVRDACGIGPKKLARVARLQRLLARARRSQVGAVRNWSGAAAWAGYYDQSHLIGEFRTLVGTTPGRYFASR